MIVSFYVHNHSIYYHISAFLSTALQKFFGFFRCFFRFSSRFWKSFPWFFVGFLVFFFILRQKREKRASFVSCFPHIANAKSARQLFTSGLALAALYSLNRINQQLLRKSRHLPQRQALSSLPRYRDRSASRYLRGSAYR